MVCTDEDDTKQFPRQPLRQKSAIPTTALTTPIPPFLLSHVIPDHLYGQGEDPVQDCDESDICRRIAVLDRHSAVRERGRYSQQKRMLVEAMND